MKTCKTCKWWGEDDWVTGMGMCDRVPHYTSYGSVHHKDNCPSKYILPMEAAVEDASGYSARLLCKESFGCTLHKDKDSAS